MNLNLIKNIGPKTENLLNKLNIYTVEDLLTFYPYRYNIIKLKNINEVTDGEVCFIPATILSACKVFYIRRNFNRLDFIVSSNNINFKVTIFNRAFLKNNLTINREVVLIGKYNKLKNTFVASDIKFSVEDNKIEVKYHLTEGIKNNTLEKIIGEALKLDYDIPDYVPEIFNIHYKLLSKSDALKLIHQPKSVEDIKKSELKLIYEELFLYMFKINYLSTINKEALGTPKHFREDELNEFLSNLSFKLTTDQETTINDILNDLKSNRRMNRLVLGDVGSGKTIVAITAIYACFLSGYQSAFMAPTEILAKQHYEQVKNYFSDYDIKVELLTGSLTKKQKEKIYERLEQGEIDLIIGTHALLNVGAEFKNLGLVITDEQHRFGVNQRAKLEDKGIDFLPDVLVMTATPIPRTMTLTVYGDLDVSFIKQLPPGRKPIRTFVRMPDRRELIYKFVRGEVQKGRQAYVVCPLIEESENSDAVSVEMIYDELTSGYLYGIRCALLHGKLSSKDKEQLLYDFLAGKIDVLISTTVIEVGVNVPNASIMVIEGAERFGLAQLHQLRGRIGRGEFASYCILINRGRNANSLERLHLMEKISDGFILAEEDLRLRGPGQFFGSMQHGLPDLKIADVLNDINVLITARKEAQKALDFSIDKKALVELLQMQYKDKFIKIADN